MSNLLEKLARPAFWCVKGTVRRAGRSTTVAGLLGIGAFRIDVGAQIARVEAEILPELHKRQTVLGLRPHVLVDPRHRDLEESSGVLRSEERVVSWIYAEGRDRPDFVGAGHKASEDPNAIVKRG